VASRGDDVTAGDANAHHAPEKPLEVVFRPAHGLAMVFLRNPTRPEPEIEYLKQAFPHGVGIIIDPKVDYVLLKLDATTLRQMTEFGARKKTWRWRL
jgi:hypothetical protein